MTWTAITPPPNTESSRASLAAGQLPQCIDVHVCSRFPRFRRIRRSLEPLGRVSPQT